MRSSGRPSSLLGKIWFLAKQERLQVPDRCLAGIGAASDPPDSALYSPYNFEIGVDLLEQMTGCDLSDVFTIPANLEKTFDQSSRAVAH
jgi:hypothetical protein